MSTYQFLQQSDRYQIPLTYVNTPVRWMPHASFVMGERVQRPGSNTAQDSGYQVLRLATELVPSTLALLGADQVSPFWAVLFYFVLILFGIAQQVTAEQQQQQQQGVTSSSIPGGPKVTANGNSYANFF